jgi:hypothetical protein
MLTAGERSTLWRQVVVDVVEEVDDTLANRHRLDIAELEVGCLDEVLLFNRREAPPEHPRLAKVILEALAAGANLVALDLLGMVYVAAHVLGRGHRAALGQRVGEVVGPSLVDCLAVEAVTLVVVDLGDGAVDGDFVEVGAAQADQLGVEVGEETALQQGVVGEVDARYHVPRMEGHLLGLGEEVVRVAVEHHLADAAHRDQLFGDDLGRSSRSKSKANSSSSSTICTPSSNSG